MGAVCICFFIDRFDFFQKTVLFHFFVIEEVSEQMLIIQLQKCCEIQPGRITCLLLGIVKKKLLIQKALVAEMRWEELVFLLQEVECLIVEGATLGKMLVEFADEKVENAF